MTVWLTWMNWRAKIHYVCLWGETTLLSVLKGILVTALLVLQLVLLPSVLNCCYITDWCITQLNFSSRKKRELYAIAEKKNHSLVNCLFIHFFYSSERIVSSGIGFTQKCTALRLFLLVTNSTSNPRDNVSDYTC